MAFVHIDAIIVLAQFKTIIAVTFIRPNEVNASAVVADVRMSHAFVYIDARVSPWRKQIPRVTNALETALQVLALPFLANVRPFYAFVDVDAVHECRAVLVTFRAFAFEASREVDALRVALARTRGSQTLVLVYALMRVDVVGVSAVALTLETAGRVHAEPVFAHGGHQTAFVDFLGLVRHGVYYLAGFRAAQSRVFTCATVDVI